MKDGKKRKTENMCYAVTVNGSVDNKYMCTCTVQNILFVSKKLC
jgi:hypothetical protein